MLENTIFGNYLLVAPFTAYFAAQIIKALLSLIKDKRVEVKKLLGSGGMPSSHSAMVTALAAAAILKYGVLSPITAIASIFAGVVMYDACGVRNEVGKHAKAINDDKFMHSENGEKKHFNEAVGHTLVQVLAGFALGVIIALVIPMY